MTTSDAKAGDALAGARVLTRLAALRHVGLDLVVAMFLSTVLVIAGAVAWALTASDELPPQLDPLSVRVSAGLDVESSADPRAQLALEQAAKLASDAGVPAAFELVDLEGVWLSGIYHRSNSDRVDPVAAASSAGIWRNSVEMGPNSIHALQEIAADPSAVTARLGWLLPWVFSSTGLGLLLWAIFCLRRREYPPWAPPEISGSRQLLLGLVIGGVALVLSLGVQQLMELVGYPVVEQDWVRDLATGSTVGFTTLILVAVVLAPIAEEAFFRGHVFRHLLAAGSRPMAYAVSAILFAVIHLNPAAMVSYLVYAILLAWCYERWRTLSVPVVAHAVVNATGVLLLRFA